MQTVSADIYFEGDSRVLYDLEDGTLLCRLKPTIFSLAKQGAVELPGIDKPRRELNALLSQVLHEKGIRTSTLETRGEDIILSREKVPPIEVVVKGALVGSPKHLYEGIGELPTRPGHHLHVGSRHKPYVRFDWRNSFPKEDACMPEALADAFIDTKQAKTTALKAFSVLREFFNQHALELLDICFFMNETGDCICAEISTDNTRITYRGCDPQMQRLFASRDSSSAIERADAILALLTGPTIPRKRLIISGPFCTGKTTLIQAMQEKLGIPKLIDHSTRPMRLGERQDFPYHFLSRDAFEENLRDDFYYEWVSFNGHYYGVPRHKLEEECWVIDILSPSLVHYQGKTPGLASVYLDPPSREELIARARERGDAEEKIHERLASMEDEDSGPFDYILPASMSLNDKLKFIQSITNPPPFNKPRLQFK